MSSRFVNLALLFDTIALLGTGVLLFSTDRTADAWLYDAHRYLGAALLVLFFPKARIIWRSLARRSPRGEWTSPTLLAGGLLTGLTLLSLVLALAWTVDRLPFYLASLLGETPLALHWYLAFALVPFFAWHAYKRWVPFDLPRPGKANGPLLSRRDALSLMVVSGAALVGFGALDALAATTHWSRRFTGSRTVQSFVPDALPVTSSEATPQIDLATWRLRVSGRVAKPLDLSYDDLIHLSSSTLNATLDCTIGWASEQAWMGIAVAELLERAVPAPDAATVEARATTGYYATLSLDEARGAFVATRIGEQVLNQEHGFPARLVAPDRRGYHWIKWMSELVVS